MLRPEMAGKMRAVSKRTTQQLRADCFATQ